MAAFLLTCRIIEDEQRVNSLEYNPSILFQAMATNGTKRSPIYHRSPKTFFTCPIPQSGNTTPTVIYERSPHRDFLILLK